MSDDTTGALVEALLYRERVLRALPPIDEKADAAMTRALNKRLEGYVPRKLKRRQP